ncbi:hypothetical protein BU17DRAFT_38799 [Hysterangium stoloniferum]|nr:hypothetical protein BU17DRAFT_38799 [Hysterangium stoloniferum]
MVNPQQTSQHLPTRGSSQSSGTRHSSRRALTAALELAQEAVRLDTTNDDPLGAIQAYARSVALLSEVMERVIRGEDANDSSRDRRRGGRRRSVAAREEEVRRLKSIHDTYADRMNILSDIYNVDPNDPSSFDALRQTEPFHNTHQPQEELMIESDRDISFDGGELIGTAMLAPSRDSTSTPDSSRTGSDHTYFTDNSLPEFEMVHPPSLQQPIPASFTIFGGANITTSSNPSILPPPRPPPSGPLPTRPRTGSLSSLHPAVPPPRIALPPSPIAPASNPESTDSSRPTLLPPGTTRSRGNSTSHRRTGSDNRLEALDEEPDLRPSSQSDLQPATVTVLFRQPHDPAPHSRHNPTDDDGYRNSIVRASSQYSAHAAPPVPPSKDTPPLPPFPPSITPLVTPSQSIPYTSPLTPRGNSSFTPQSHPFSAQEPPAHPSRARGVSTPTLRSEGYGQSVPPLVINTNPPSGTISQRRSKSSTGTISSQSSSPPGTAHPVSPPPQSLPVVRLTASSIPANTASSLGIGRNRSSSQPPRPAGTGSGSSLSEFGVRSPIPALQNFPNIQVPISRKSSFPSRLNPHIQPPSGTPQASNTVSYFPTSPLPSAPPADPLRKPYHLMSLLWATMTSKSGGYITRRLHVPHEVWSQGGAKLLNLPEKVRVVEVLCGALEEVLHASNELTSGTGVIDATSCNRTEVERWLSKLDEWNGVCESIVGSIGKKLGVGEGFGAKKSGGVTSWSKFAQSFNRMTNGKNLDSPASYVAGLTKLFQQAQILDDHTKAFLASPPSPLYIGLPMDLRQLLELRLKRSSEFFASVVLTFVVRDLSQLLDKYVKKGEKWLAE